MTQREQKLQYSGLTTEEAKKAQKKYGKNELTVKKNDGFLTKVAGIIKEPMFVLLLVASVIYFILGEPKDGTVMIIFVLVIISIEIIQEWKTDRTLSALKDLSAPSINVIRDGIEKTILSSDLVPGDLMLIFEGVKIPADGKVISSNDLCVDESSLTGESVGVWKSTVHEDSDGDGSFWRKDYCYAGTLVTQGRAMVLVDKIGLETEYGKISRDIISVPQSPTPLQKQTGRLVKVCTIIAAILFLLTACATFFNVSYTSLNERIIQSILSGITLSMATIPEEFPVILTVFLSMGAWRLAKNKSLVRKLPSVETLGAVSVICVDKTGTITKNSMTVTQTWAIDGDNENLHEVMGLACETETYDPMELAMLEFCEQNGITKEHLFTSEFMSEYSFTNELKMMGHVWKHEGEIIIAVKGSPEQVLKISNLSDKTKNDVQQRIDDMSKRGLRVIAVGMMKLDNKDQVPSDILQCELAFCGLIGLEDPPRDSVKDDIQKCTKAGVRVVMITGDNGITASSIAAQIGMPASSRTITGDELNKMSDDELREAVKGVNVFSRVVPEHKMRIVKALKDNGEIVAMTGDGVNDAPALKYADIGIAMGKGGTEVSREAADLILLDDNFSTIVNTIKDGRRIYDNIKKAVAYVFAIHIPIAFAALLAPFLGVGASSLLFLPVHVMLMELFIDPTCSIVFERQPAEKNIMDRKPRNPKSQILTPKTLLKSVIQGIVIFIASFGTYYFFLMNNPNDAATARAMGITIIMLSNLFLVQVNSSDSSCFFESIKLLFKDRVMWAVNIITIAVVIIILYSPINLFLKLAPLTLYQIGLAFVISAVSVLWYEVVKFINKHK